jgi:hypothetical protein
MANGCILGTRGLAGTGDDPGSRIVKSHTRILKSGEFPLVISRMQSGMIFLKHPFVCSTRPGPNPSVGQAGMTISATARWQYLRAWFRNKP